ncbi:uncharacterized protein LOC116109365 isoform X4 [Pistacia vera]|uniref:uncharacterized protein LOC116109365 isoform X4 n=1 Tax=Pistacia vera TaxID=55513 RepID=UPI001263E4D4|nr:uncharacterized protein LOC116109365 isoform X4 [Pistacia vera]
MLPRCSGALSSLKNITHRNHIHGSAAAVAPAPTPTKQPVNLRLSKWMKESEKIFYGNIVAYDAAMLPEAKQDELQNAVTWVIARGPWVRNIFSDDGTSKPDDAALRAVQAMTRYVRREVSCLSLTGKEAIFSGNFMFTPLEIIGSGPLRK